MARRRNHLDRSKLSAADRASLTDLLARYGIHAQSIAPFGDDPTTLRVNDDLLVRFDDRPDRRRLAWEARICRRLLQDLGFDSPEVIALDTQYDLLPRDVLILGNVPGVPLSSIWRTLDADDRERVSEEIGRLVGMIHTLTWPVYGDLVVDDSAVTSARWCDVVLRRVQQACTRAIQSNLFPASVLDGLITTFNDGDAIFEAATPPTLSHTALTLDHLLALQIEGRWSASALLHWTSSTLADAAWEFAALWQTRDDVWPQHDGFVYGYRERHPISGDLQARQHLYRLLLATERAVDQARVLGAESPATVATIAAITRQLTAL